jgi:hypothetical protein
MIEKPDKLLIEHEKLDHSKEFGQIYIKSIMSSNGTISFIGNIHKIQRESRLKKEKELEMKVSNNHKGQRKTF